VASSLGTEGFKKRREGENQWERHPGVRPIVGRVCGGRQWKRRKKKKTYRQAKGTAKTKTILPQYEKKIVESRKEGETNEKVKTRPPRFKRQMVEAG